MGPLISSQEVGGKGMNLMNEKKPNRNTLPDYVGMAGFVIALAGMLTAIIIDPMVADQVSGEAVHASSTAWWLMKAGAVVLVVSAALALLEKRR